MPEYGDSRVRTPLFDQTRQQGKVIVLGQNNGAFRAGHLFENGVRELLVGRLVILPILYPKYGARVRDVAERPKALISEPVIVAFFFLSRQPDTPQSVLRLFRRYPETIVFIHGSAVRIAGA